MSELREVLKTALAVSAPFLKQRFGNSQVVSQQGRDIKLAEDAESQRQIVQHLMDASSLPVLTEEEGWIGDRPDTDGVYWVVDPLDGSYNFKKGIPLCCISIALCRGMDPVLGGTHDFIRDEIFIGGRSEGLTLNGEELKAPAGTYDVLATGFPVSSADGDEVFEDLRAQTGDWKKVRMIGSAALSLTWVACGRFDGYREIGIKWWDVAAGLALVQGAGGVSELADISSAHTVSILAHRGDVRVSS